MFNNLPQAIVIGAPKSGTTSFYHYTLKHPNLCWSEVKEPFFFSYYGDTQKFNSPDQPKIYSSLEEYLQLFNGSGLRIEASTWGLYHADKLIKNVEKVYKNYQPKILIFLRSPAERAISHYSMHLRNNWEPLGFREACEHEQVALRMEQNWAPTYDYIGMSKYHEKIAKVKKYFSNVYLIKFDDFIKKPKSELTKIYKFLEIEEFYDKNQIGSIHNKSGLTRFQSLRYLKNIPYLKATLQKSPPIIFNLAQKIYFKEINLRQELKYAEIQLADEIGYFNEWDY